MAYNKGNRDYIEWAEEAATPYAGDFGILEYVQAGAQQVWDEDMTISSHVGGAFGRQRDSDLRDKIETGEIPRDVELAFTNWEFGRGYYVDYSGLAEHAKTSLGLVVKNDEDVTTERDEYLASRRLERQSKLSEASGGDMAAYFLGSLGPSMVDPGAIAMGFATLGVSRYAMGAKAFSKILKAHSIKSSAALGALGAAGVEPFIYSWKEEIGQEYTVNDALFNIAASGLFSGTITAAGKAIRKRFKGVDLDDADQATVDRMAEEAEAAPNPRESAETHNERTERTAEDMDASQSQPNPGAKYDAEDSATIDRAYEEIDPDTVIVNEDGSTTTVGEQEAELKRMLEDQEEYIRCMNSGP